MYIHTYLPLSLSLSLSLSIYIYICIVTYSNRLLVHLGDLGREPRVQRTVDLGGALFFVCCLLITSVVVINPF